MSTGVWCFTTDPAMQRESCSVPTCSSTKVLDFSADNDDKPDENGQYTMARLFLPESHLPESFTICSALRVDAWTSKSITMFDLLDICGSTELQTWGSISIYGAPGYTEYTVSVGKVSFVRQVEAVFFPLQWTRACFSLDSVSSKVTLVVDGHLLGEEEYKREEDYNRPGDIRLHLGSWVEEYAARIADLNMFESSFSVQRMVDLTTAGGKECGAPGDLVSWEEAEWTLFSQAKLIPVDREWEGSCRRESQVQLFTADFEEHTDCMQHCQKISDGRSPPLITEEEWEDLKKEIDLITRNRKILKKMWLSATEGDNDNHLEKPANWPDTEVVKNETKTLEAIETVWRDYYTGQRLKAYPKPFNRHIGNADTMLGETGNCMAVDNKRFWTDAWFETQCSSPPDHTRCPCSYSGQPLLRLRGLCSPLIDSLYSTK